MNNTKFDFKDKIVVVTGGARGIGKCIAEQFKSAGAKVCVIDLFNNDYLIAFKHLKGVKSSLAGKTLSAAAYARTLIYRS